MKGTLIAYKISDLSPSQEFLFESMMDLNDKKTNI